MIALLDELVYPWHNPVAQQLHRTLIALFPANQSVPLLAAEAQVDTTMIFQQQPVALLWKDVLEAAARANRVRALVQRALDRLLPDHPARPFLQQLLDGETPAVNAEPRAQDGTPAFLHADDSVSEPEALLFGDDLTMPIGQVSVLVETLRKVLLVGPSVCKLTVGFGAGEQYGTAFRIGPDLLLTNWHVVHRRSDGAPAVAVNAEFRFEDAADHGLLAPRAVRCEPVSVQSDRPDDWAVVRSVDPLDPVWPVIPLINLRTPAVHDPAYIVQHPMGQRKRVGFVRNLISYLDERVVHYLTDTDVGSSGSPVLNADGQLIAVHHRGGRPQETGGNPPVRKNEGIRLSRIAAALSARGMAAQGVVLDGNDT